MSVELMRQLIKLIGEKNIPIFQTAVNDWVETNYQNFRFSNDPMYQTAYAVEVYAAGLLQYLPEYWNHFNKFMTTHKIASNENESMYPFLSENQNAHLMQLHDTGIPYSYTDGNLTVGMVGQYHRGDAKTGDEGIGGGAVIGRFYPDGSAVSVWRASNRQQMVDAVFELVKAGYIKKDALVWDSAVDTVESMKEFMAKTADIISQIPDIKIGDKVRVISKSVGLDSIPHSPFREYIVTGIYFPHTSEWNHWNENNKDLVGQVIPFPLDEPIYDVSTIPVGAFYLRRDLVPVPKKTADIISVTPAFEDEEGNWHFQTPLPYDQLPDEIKDKAVENYRYYWNQLDVDEEISQYEDDAKAYGLRLTVKEVSTNPLNVECGIIVSDWGVFTKSLLKYFRERQRKFPQAIHPVIPKTAWKALLQGLVDIEWYDETAHVEDHGAEEQYSRVRFSWTDALTAIANLVTDYFFDLEKKYAKWLEAADQPPNDEEMAENFRANEYKFDEEGKIAASIGTNIKFADILSNFPMSEVRTQPLPNSEWEVKDTSMRPLLANSPRTSTVTVIQLGSPDFPETQGNHAKSQFLKKDLWANNQYIGITKRDAVLHPDDVVLTTYGTPHSGWSWLFFSIDAFYYLLKPKQVQVTADIIGAQLPEEMVVTWDELPQYMRPYQVWSPASDPFQLGKYLFVIDPTVIDEYVSGYRGGYKYKGFKIAQGFWAPWLTNEEFIREWMNHPEFPPTIWTKDAYGVQPMKFRLVNNDFRNTLTHAVASLKFGDIIQNFRAQEDDVDWDKRAIELLNDFEPSETHYADQANEILASGLPFGNWLKENDPTAFNVYKNDIRQQGSQSSGNRQVIVKKSLGGIKVYLDDKREAPEGWTRTTSSAETTAGTVAELFDVKKVGDNQYELILTTKGHTQYEDKEHKIGNMTFKLNPSEMELTILSASLPQGFEYLFANMIQYLGNRYAAYTLDGSRIPPQFKQYWNIAFGSLKFSAVPKFSDILTGLRDEYPTGRRIKTTYAIITPESAQTGDFAETGWEDEEGKEIIVDMADEEYDTEFDSIVGQTVKWLEYYGASEQANDDTYSNVDPLRDYETGEEMYLDYHLSGYTPQELAAIAERMKARRLGSLKFSVKEATHFYRGGPDSAMPRNKTALDVINYERHELGNKDLRVLMSEKALASIPAQRLIWVTKDKRSAKEYGEVSAESYPTYRIIAYYPDTPNEILIDRGIYQGNIKEAATRRPYTTRTTLPFLDKKHQEVLQAETLVDNGDCVAIARAFRKLFGAELFAVDATNAEQMETYGADGHAFVWYKGKFYDGYGEIDPQKLLAYYNKNNPDVGYMIIKVENDVDYFKKWNNSKEDTKRVLKLLENVDKAFKTADILNMEQSDVWTYRIGDSFEFITDTESFEQVWQYMDMKLLPDYKQKVYDAGYPTIYNFVYDCPITLLGFNLRNKTAIFGVYSKLHEPPVQLLTMEMPFENVYSDLIKVSSKTSTMPQPVRDCLDYPRFNLIKKDEEQEVQV